MGAPSHPLICCDVRVSSGAGSREPAPSTRSARWKRLSSACSLLFLSQEQVFPQQPLPRAGGARYLHSCGRWQKPLSGWQPALHSVPGRRGEGSHVRPRQGAPCPAGRARRSVGRGGPDPSPPGAECTQETLAGWDGGGPGSHRKDEAGAGAARRGGAGRGGSDAGSPGAGGRSSSRRRQQSSPGARPSMPEVQLQRGRHGPALPQPAACAACALRRAAPSRRHGAGRSGHGEEEEEGGKGGGMRGAPPPSPGPKAPRAGCCPRLGPPAQPGCPSCPGPVSSRLPSGPEGLVSPPRTRGGGSALPPPRLVPPGHEGIKQPATRTGAADLGGPQPSGCPDG